MKLLIKVACFFLLFATFSCQREEEPAMDLNLLTTYNWALIQASEYRVGISRQIYLDTTLYSFQTNREYTVYTTNAEFREGANGEKELITVLEESHTDEYTINMGTNEITLHFPPNTWHGSASGIKKWQILAISAERMTIIEEIPALDFSAQYDLMALPK